MQRGSILILAVVVVLILSIMAIAGLTVTSIEALTTNNYYLSKQAFYRAQGGVEEIRSKIIEYGTDTTSIVELKKETYDTKIGSDMVYTAYITGDLKDFGDSVIRTIEVFQGFNPPQINGTSLGNDNINISPIIWYVPITAVKKTSGNVAYSEIQTGVLSTVEALH